MKPDKLLGASRNRLSTLVGLRWLAIAGQVTTILVAQLATTGLPLVPVLAAVGAAVALNAWMTFLRKGNWQMGEGQAALQLGFDVAQLVLLLAVTGGLMNPFSLFLLAPVAVAAAILPARRVALVAGWGLTGLVVLGFWHLPLPWAQEQLFFPGLYLFGVGVALALGIGCLAFFVWRMAEESRGIAIAFASTQLALEREQRVAEVGALAAAVAHELNTPLATISLIAHDLAEALRGGEFEQDMQVLIDQSERCRLTIAHLTQRSGQDRAVEGERVAFPSLVELAAAPYAQDGVEVLFDHEPAPASGNAPVPWLRRSPEILHGLGNFIQNAIQFAGSRVEIDTCWNEDGFAVRICDDGPGFPDHLLGSLGQPYVSGRETSSGNHLGLGIFIAQTLLARTGATIAFGNPAAGGAEIVVKWEMEHGAHHEAVDRR